MKVKVVHWLRRDLPKWLCANIDGTYEVSAEDIMRLFREGYDVMLTHHQEPIVIGSLCLDDPGCKFRQR